MIGNSKEVESSQSEIHPDLEKFVLRALETEFRRPIAEHTLRAFEEAEKFVARFSTPVILDSGCGTGLSTVALAKKFPENPVLGIDKSAVRLEKADTRARNAGTFPQNALHVRAELIDFWKLVKEAKWNVRFHAIFYPNPWPKPAELRYRFHGHPIFPTLVEISPKLELRTNWKIYADEFRFALELVDRQLNLHGRIGEENFVPAEPITAFEKKFLESGHTLWKVGYEKVPVAGDL